MFVVFPVWLLTFSLCRTKQQSQLPQAPQLQLTNRFGCYSDQARLTRPCSPLAPPTHKWIWLWLQPICELINYPIVRGGINNPLDYIQALNSPAKAGNWDLDRGDLDRALICIPPIYVSWIAWSNITGKLATSRYCDAKAHCDPGIGQICSNMELDPDSVLLAHTPAFRFLSTYTTNQIEIS